jgi:dTDP-4-dehydrorhamnose reductase
MSTKAVRQRILITGVSGFLGQHLAQHLRDRHEVIGTYREHALAPQGCVARRLDITNQEGIRELCREFRPDGIIHLAVQGDLDRCQRDPDEAYCVNVQGTVHVARAAAEMGARLIYISTDQVYDGAQGLYDETDPAQPLMVYGRTKLEGEQQAAAICPHVVTLRLALMYGWGNPSRPTFIDWMLARLQASQEVPLWVDQYRTPLYVVHAAEVIGQLVDRPEVRGIFNLGGAERLDRLSFGRKFCEIFELPTQSLKSVAMASAAASTPRPQDCSMRSAKISALLGIKLLTVEEGLRALKRWREG